MTRITSGGTLAAILAAVIALSAITGCGLTGSAGPLQNLTTGGQPQFTIAWAAYIPGQTADFAAYVVNSGSGPVTLISASLVPIVGHPAGHLTRLAVGARHDTVAAERGWPPGIPIIPFRSARLPKGQSNIIFGFTVPDVGRTYMAAGITITYRYRGQTYTVTAWSAATACVVSEFTNAGGADCARQSEIAKNATQRLASG